MRRNLIGLQRDFVGRKGAFESSRKELAVNGKPKTLAFSLRVMAIRLSAQIKGGKVDLKNIVFIMGQSI